MNECMYVCTHACMHVCMHARTVYALCINIMLNLHMLLINLFRTSQELASKLWTVGWVVSVLIQGFRMLVKSPEIPG